MLWENKKCERKHLWSSTNDWGKQIQLPFKITLCQIIDSENRKA